MYIMCVRACVCACVCVCMRVCVLISYNNIGVPSTKSLSPNSMQANNITSKRVFTKAMTETKEMEYAD